MGLIMDRYILVDYIPFFFYIILSINYNNLTYMGKETFTR